jgi:hypothetical protein
MQKTGDPLTDNWIDDEFNTLDLSTGPKPIIPVESSENEPPAPAEVTLQPEIVENTYPKVVELGDGASVTIEKTPKGLKAVLDQGNGSGSETFYGNDESDLLTKVLAAKLNATKKIRQLTRQVKITRETAQAAPTQTQATPAVRKLDANDIFEIKTQLDANPDLALELWFQKKTGLSVQALVELAQTGSIEGKQANEKLRIEAEATRFRQLCPNYFPTDENLAALCDHLEARGQEFNAKNLVNAFEDLSEAGLLEMAPVAKPENTPTAQAPAAVTTQTNTSRIAQPVRSGKRASLGLSTRDTTPVPTVEDRGPSEAELNNLSDEQIRNLMAGVRQLRASSRR